MEIIKSIVKVKFLLWLFFLSISASIHTQKGHFVLHEIETSVFNNISAEFASLTTDRNGNYYATGFFSDTAYIGGQLLISSGALDIFFAKFNPKKELVWIKQAGGTDIDFCRFANTDRLNNVYITGLFRGILFFEDTILNSNGNYDLFHAKYSDKGEMLWIKRQ